MDSLDNTEWDVVICGTGLPQSLLALALSRSEKKVLHVDPNSYYGGHEAALSLAEAEIWAEKHSGDSPAIFTHAKVTKLESSDAPGGKLLSSRAYSIALAPHLIYSRSPLIDILVSSHTHTQLDFQAVGSWFIANAPPGGSASQARLTRVPGGREDIFQDGTLDLKEKRALMKFLRFVSKYEDEPDVWRNCNSKSFPDFLQERFNLPPSAHAPILALTLETAAPSDVGIETALAGIARHLQSIGFFGAGFGAVLPKWGGLAEIGQVACRACAVGGGVYVLGQGISEISTSNEEQVRLRLSNGEHVKTKWIAGHAEDLPISNRAELREQPNELLTTSRSICIVSSPLTSLFPQTSEGGVTPAGAVVLVPPSTPDEPPVYIFVHSSESGECPSNQCVLYASVTQNHENGFDRLKNAVHCLLESVGEMSMPQVLWNMNYEHQTVIEAPTPQAGEKANDGVILMSPLSPSLVLEDEVMETVRNAWQEITEADLGSFMKFEVREGVQDDDDDDGSAS